MAATTTGWLCMNTENVILLCTFISVAVIVSVVSIIVVKRAKGRLLVEAYLMMMFVLFPVLCIASYLLVLSIIQATQ